MELKIMKASLLALAVVLAAMVASPAFAKSAPLFIEAEHMERTGAQLVVNDVVGGDEFSGGLAVRLDHPTDTLSAKMATKEATAILFRVWQPQQMIDEGRTLNTIHVSVDGEEIDAAMIDKGNFNVYSVSLEGAESLKNKGIVSLYGEPFTYGYIELDYVRVVQ